VKGRILGSSADGGTISAEDGSLIAKYGQPYATKTWGVLQDETDYTWVSNPAAYDPRVCAPETYSYRAYFYEELVGDHIVEHSAEEAGKLMLMFPFLLAFAVFFVGADFGSLLLLMSPIHLSFFERWGALLFLAAALPVYAYWRGSKSVVGLLALGVCLLAFIYMGNRPWFSSPP
jgi:hypothetical protein